MRVKRHFFNLIQDKVLCWTFLVWAILISNHIYMLIDSGYKIEPAIRVAYCCVYLILALIMGRKCWNFQMLLIAFSIMYYNRWNNYTSWIFVLIVSYRNYKYRAVLYSIYAAAAIVCIAIGHRDITHTCLHFTHCFCIYFLLELAKIQLNSEKPLNLTDDELIIIKQLAAGKLKKEITGFSKNTVTAKIKDACRRNKCIEGELIWRYRQNPL